MEMVTKRRLAGIVLPLFSVRSHSDWGVGEFPDLGRCAPILERAGLRLLMTLPLLEPTPGQESPYAPLSAFALDPLYVSLDAVPELHELGGREALSVEDRGWLRTARGASNVRHDLVRPLKQRWLRRCFEKFVQLGSAHPRRRDFEDFCGRHADWLDDYALFRTLKVQHPQSWHAWPHPLRNREPEALRAARQTHSEAMAFRRYIQWVAWDQLLAARGALVEAGVALGGDEPFLTAEDSADVWARQHLYRFDATVGAPPDAFSADGQDWGLPPYRWEAIRSDGFALFRARGERAAQLFDAVRIDHVVGLYRTYHRPVDGGAPYFVPAREAEQRAQGEAALRAFAEGGSALIAEDLGVIPDFVRASLWDISLPGFRILRWECRDNDIVPPASWPAHSVAALGTHDTEPAAVWWDGLTGDERRVMRKFPRLSELPESLTERFNHQVHRALLEVLYASPSNIALLSAQDIFALRDRVNLPSTVGPHNWTTRLPWSISTFDREDHLAAQLDDLAELARRTGRLDDRAA